MKCKEVQYTHLVTYVDQLRSEALSEATVSRSIAALRGFFKYLELNQYLIANPADHIKSIKSKESLPTVLTQDEVNIFLSQPDQSPKGKRDKAMFELLYASGIRSSELTNLKLKDVNLNLAYIQVTDGKHQRIIPIGKTCIQALHDYIVTSRKTFLKGIEAKEEDQAFFLNTRGKELTRQGFWKIVKSYNQSSNIEIEITPHVLRHSFASHLIQNGADIKSVQEMMGHECIASTLIYTKTGNHKLKEVYLKAHPRA
jgi:integrase/recombinase XerD